MFKRMGIDGKDVRVLQKVFEDMDLDGNKRIDALEVHSHSQYHINTLEMNF